jgi:alpha-N-arabinofuranosidase
MYKIGGWYYLLIAEGGTEYGHMVTIARSKNVWGPFESCPRNPILSHRDDICSPFQALGHADITTDPQGNWYMVFHAIRPTNAQLHHIGRETMLAPFTWDDAGWPLVNGGKSVPAEVTGPGEGTGVPVTSWREDFCGETFHPRWTWLRNPDLDRYGCSKSGLTLRGCEFTLDSLESPTFIGVRQRQLNVCYETEMAITGEQGRAGITVFHTAEHHYDLQVRRQGSGLSCRKSSSYQGETVWI